MLNRPNLFSRFYKNTYLTHLFVFSRRHIQTINPRSKENIRYVFKFIKPVYYRSGEYTNDNEITLRLAPHNFTELSRNRKKFLYPPVNLGDDKKQIKTRPPLYRQHKNNHSTDICMCICPRCYRDRPFPSISFLVRLPVAAS